MKSIIDCFSEVPPASDVPFDRLHGRVTKMKLNLLEAREMFNTEHDDINPVEEYLLRKHESLPLLAAGFVKIKAGQKKAD